MILIGSCHLLVHTVFICKELTLKWLCAVLLIFWMQLSPGPGTWHLCWHSWDTSCWEEKLYDIVKETLTVFMACFNNISNLSTLWPLRWSNWNCCFHGSTSSAFSYVKNRYTVQPLQSEEQSHAYLYSNYMLLITKRFERIFRFNQHTCNVVLVVF